MEMLRISSDRTLKQSEGVRSYRQILQSTPRLCRNHLPQQLNRDRSCQSSLHTGKALPEMPRPPHEVIDRGTKKVGCLFKLFMIYIKHAPEETAWSTHALNDCHNGHPQCIDKTMLSSLPAARRATREDKNMIARSSRCIKLEPLHGYVLNFFFSQGICVSILCILSLVLVIVNQY